MSLWKKMSQAHAGKQPPQFLSTHPAPGTRIHDLSALEPLMQPVYAAASKAPVAAPSRLADNVKDLTPNAPVQDTKPLTLISNPKK